jgi:hypothetical protein
MEEWITFFQRQKCAFYFTGHVHLINPFRLHIIYFKLCFKQTIYESGIILQITIKTLKYAERGDDFIT